MNLGWCWGGAGVREPVELDMVVGKVGVVIVAVVLDIGKNCIG